MALFKAPQRSGRDQDALIAKKSNSKSRTANATIKDSGGLIGRISAINAMVNKHLSKYEQESMLIQDEQTLIQYIDHSISNGVISIDTETSGLDPMLDEVAGVCIYTPGEKTAYIPLNHISYITFMPVPNQLSVQFVKEQLQRIVDSGTKVIMFNAPFDVRVIRNRIGVRMKCYWDCYLAARLLNENEGAGNNNLKKLHQKYVLNGEGDAFRFDDLFKGIPFPQIPIKTGYLYAAHDAIITYELYKYQEPFLDPTNEECTKRNLEQVSWVFHNIEMPIVDVVCDMEDTGVAFDISLADELSVKYHSLLNDEVNRFNSLCDTYSSQIETYRIKNPGNKLGNPINIGSSTQIAILLYDILKIDPPDPKNARGTGEDILSKIDNPIAECILAYRGLDKLIGTYIDKLPNCVNPNDGRIHCKFNQYGADTGRFSSSDPNLQNIPSHNKDIRKMFKATEGYVLMSSDFSQQEPKCLAALCRKDGDPQMYNTFMEGKDLYSEIASKAFNVPYEDCREFRPDGTTNKEGKERRSQAKSILLGVLYGRGEKSIAEQLGCTEKKAKDIKQSVFRGFPAIKKFEEDSLDMAHDIGFVTTVCGRKRRLPDLQLDPYEFKWKEGSSPSDDLLNFDDTDFVEDDEVPYNRVNYYTRKLDKCWGRQKQKVIEEAFEEGIIITDNGGKIADATRQCVNSRIQGSAADLTKLAMIELSANERLRELGFRTLIPVHDEIIAECPKENAKECAELLASTMSKAAEKILEMPIKCDVEVTEKWYGDTVAI